jgi:hypothetical protein
MVVGTLIFGTGLTYELVARKVTKTQYRMIVGAALLLIALLIGADLAVGVFGTPFSGS